VENLDKFEWNLDVTSKKKTERWYGCSPWGV